MQISYFLLISLTLWSRHRYKLIAYNYNIEKTRVTTVIAFIVLSRNGTCADKVFVDFWDRPKEWLILTLISNFVQEIVLSMCSHFQNISQSGIAVPLTTCILSQQFTSWNTNLSKRILLLYFPTTSAGVQTYSYYQHLNKHPKLTHYTDWSLISGVSEGKQLTDW